MPEEPPEFVPTTPDGESFHEFLDWRFDPHENTVVGNEYPGEDYIDVHPKDEAGRDYHPYELEIFDQPDGTVELRCYYGTIYYSIAAIQVQSVPLDASASDANKAWGVKGQSALPGFGNLTPAAFINREKGVSSKYAKFKPSGKKASDGSLHDSCVGDVVLEFVLDSANHAITEAQVLFFHKDVNIPVEEPCGKLDVENNKLRRENTKGKYYLKIGSFNKASEAAVSITQCIEDHVYYATTIIDVSADKEDGDDTKYDDTVVPTETDADTFSAVDPVNDDVDIIPGDKGGLDEEGTEGGDPTPEDRAKRDTSVQPNTHGGADNLSTKYGNNQPNNKFRMNSALARTGVYDDGTTGNEDLSRDIKPKLVSDYADDLEIPAIIHPQGAFYQTGAAGSPATSDGTGYVTTGEIPSISPIIADQIKSPQGSPGGSPSSGDYPSSSS